MPRKIMTSCFVRVPTRLVEMMKGISCMVRGSIQSDDTRERGAKKCIVSNLIQKHDNT